MAPDVDHSANIGRQGDLVVFDRSSDTVPERTPEALYPGQACRLPELPQLFVTRVSRRVPHPLVDHSRRSGAEERVLVTGGSGFIGTNLVAAYLREQTPVMSLHRRPPRIPAHRAVWTQTDIRDFERLAASLAGFAPTVVVHLAARTDLRGRTASDYSDEYARR